MRYLLLLAAVALSGCGPSTEHRQAVSSSAATIYEAAVAIERGAAPGAPLAAIKQNAYAIIIAEGYTYSPASNSGATK